jgi:alpha-amylase
MGVIYHAHARFLDKHGNKITVPAPCDPETPDAPWWYDWIAAQAAKLRRAGFTSILYPPVCKTQSGHYPTGDGYGVYDQYDLGSKNQCGSRETRFGTREQLQRSIAVARACGLDVYLDIVMHQLNGGANGIYEYLGADGKTKDGRFPKHPGCFRGAPPRRPQDPVPVPFYDYAFGDELVYVNCRPPGYTTDNMIAYGDWLTRSLDVAGYRVDDTKGTAVAFVHKWMTSRAMATRFCVGEYFDGNPENLHWWVHDSGMEGRSAAFDFTLHWALQSMCDDPNFDMRRLNGAGYLSRDPTKAVTFVDNLDTDLSPGQQIIGNKLLAYAFVLTSEGYPCVSHKDYAEEPGCYHLKNRIDNLIWIHENLANGTTVTRWSDAKTFVFERLGAPGLLTALSTDPWNRRMLQCQTSFGSHVQLHDYTGRHGDIWTDGSGRATFTIPSNEHGRAESYLCFSRVGRDRAIELVEHATTQIFFGAHDLDVAPARGESTVLAGRIWCARHKPLSAWLRSVDGHSPESARLTLRIIGPDGTVVGTHAFDLSKAGSLHITPTQSGWYQLEVGAIGFEALVPYELTVEYTSTQTLPD